MIKEKQAWNNFVVRNHGSFLQSWQWGKFQEFLGRPCYYLEGDGFKGFLIKHALPFNKSYLYCPRGPVCEKQKSADKFIKKAVDLCRQKGVVFLKLEPPQNIPLSGLEEKFHLVEAPKKIQPSQTIILSLNGSENDLINQMRAKTRYNIRLAARQGLSVSWSRGKISCFLNLLRQTSLRGNFRIHDLSYYQKIIDMLGGEIVELISVQYQQKTVAANLVGFFGQTAYYLHGASDYCFRKMMAPYLLQWETIKEAKKRGCRQYDFCGIDEEKLPGVTHFKKGFGGKRVVYEGSFDFVTRPWWYQAYSLARKIF